VHEEYVVLGDGGGCVRPRIMTPHPQPRRRRETRSLVVCRRP
jgi:hypothetical protein